MLHRYLIVGAVSLLILLVLSPFWVIKMIGLGLVKIGNAALSVRSPRWYNRMEAWCKNYEN